MTDVPLDRSTAGERAAALGWLAATAGVGWAVAAFGSGAIHLSRDLFVLLHTAATALVAAVYVRSRRIDLARAVRARPKATAIATLVAGAVAVRSVFLQPGAARSSGAKLAWEALWDGVAYGAADAVLLTVIPMAAVMALFAQSHPGSVARVERAGAALVASLLVFAAYHLGFAEFRGALLVWPLVSGMVMGLAYLACENPVAPVLVHAAMHVAAVLHGPAGTLQLPPHY